MKRCTVLCVIAVAVLPAANAQGAVVQMHLEAGESPSRADLVVTALPDEANQITIGPGAVGSVVVRDDGAALFAGDNCTGGGAQVTCSGMTASTELQLSVSAVDGADRITIEETLRYGYGSLIGGAGDDVIVGGRGRDDIGGSRGDDQLFGGAGGDGLSGDQGADSLHGGRGTDTARWGGDAPVSVTLDDRPDDGNPGEGDNAASDIENLRGGQGPNRLVGSDAANTLEGGGSTNELIGGGGNDTLDASEGDGGLLSGGPGRDRLKPSDENSIDIRDGEVDKVECPGRLARAPRLDSIDRLELCAPDIMVRGRFGLVTADGRVELGLLCLAIGQRCRARLVVRTRPRPLLYPPPPQEILAEGTIEVAPGRVRESIRLNGAGRAVLARRGKLTVEARVEGFARGSRGYPHNSEIVLKRI